MIWLGAAALLAGGSLGWRYLALLEAREVRAEERDARRAVAEDNTQRRLSALEADVRRLETGLQEAQSRLAWRNGG